MDISIPFEYSDIRPAPSSNGQYVAYITEKGLKGSKLVIRHSETLVTKHIINLDQEFSNNLVGISWCNLFDDKLQLDSERDIYSNRLVVASRHKALVFVLSTVGENAYNVRTLEGISASITSISDILWVNQDHILVWSEQSMDVSVWCVLGTANRVLKLGEIAKPKISTKASLLKWTRLLDDSYAYLFLSRSEARDELVTVVADKNKFHSVRLSTPDFVDLQVPTISSPSSKASLTLLNLSSSPFIALNDAAFLGYSVGLWFLDANLSPYFLREFSRWPQSIHPSTAGVNFTQIISSDLVLVADDEDNITILSASLNFEPVQVFQHGTVITADSSYSVNNTVVWGLGSDANYKSGLINGVDGGISTVGTYKSQKLPFFPRQGDTILRGVTIMSVSPSGRYIASVLKHMPTTVWIWAIDQRRSAEGEDTIQDDNSSGDQSRYGIIRHTGPVAVLDHSDRVSSLTWRENDFLDGNKFSKDATTPELDALLIFMPQRGSVSIWSPHGAPVSLWPCSPTTVDSYSTLTAPLRGISWTRSTINKYQFTLWDSRSLVFAAVNSGLEGPPSPQRSGSISKKIISNNITGGDQKLENFNNRILSTFGKQGNKELKNVPSQKKSRLAIRTVPVGIDTSNGDVDSRNQTFNEEYETSAIRRKRHGTSTSSMLDARDNDPVAKYLITQVQQQSWMQGNDSINSEDPAIDLDDTFAFKKIKPNNK